MCLPGFALRFLSPASLAFSGQTRRSAPTFALLHKKALRLTKEALLSLRLPPKSSFTSSKLRFWSLRKPKNSSFYSNLNRRGWPILGQPHAGVFGLLRPAATSSMNRGGLKSFDSTILVLLYSLNLSYRPYGRYLYSVRFEIPHCVSG